VTEGRRPKSATQQCPRLIEVALPVREISAESVRQKSPQRGHISTLHLWWARRPIAASRAVVFASLVPDPDDPRCPATFHAAVERHLKTHVLRELRYYGHGRSAHEDPDPYRPYDSVPDTLRNRLLMFIAKWSPESLAFESGKRSKAPAPKELLDDRSLVKWETSDPENAQGLAVLLVARELVKAAHGHVIPTVLDPFAGGGAIPLEAGRLECRAIANDYNPVAYLILRATCEFPRKYGIPGTRKVKQGGVEVETQVPNVLVHDLEAWATWVLELARGRISHLYPPGRDGRAIVGYLWVRTARCSNPTCQGEMPLLRSPLVCDKPGRRIALAMDVDKKQKCVRFGIAEGKSITRTDGTMQNRGNVLCPYCGQVTPVTDLRAAGLAGQMGEQMVAVITEDKAGKGYRPVEESDLRAFAAACKIAVERPQELILPEVDTEDAAGAVSNSTGIRVHLYGLKTWGSLFNPRQLVAMQTFVSCLHETLDAMKAEVEDEEYRAALGIYLGLWVSRLAQRNSNVGLWDKGEEKFAHPFGRQAIPMTWDYPESNPFSDSSGSAKGNVNLMARVIRREAQGVPCDVLRGDAANLPLASGSVDLVVTDPPYFDAIAYADLSDYFYVWIKRAIGDLVPDLTATPLTPKSDEATALKHRHGGDGDAADRHFQAKLGESLAEAHRVLGENRLMSIMFAHQSTKAWTALVHAILGAGLTIVATWPVDTELVTALKASMSALSSSVTVVCRPRVVVTAGAFKDVRNEIQSVVAEAVKRFWSYGLRGADLIVACYGPAVGVFGKYEGVEKADGTPVGVPELLELAKEAARDAIAGEFRGDSLSTLYYVWATLYGAAEQAWDDARLVIQIGGQSESAMEVARGHSIFAVDGSKCRLALLSDRESRKGLGTDDHPALIDALHRSMLLWRKERRAELVGYLDEHGLLEDGPFWKLAQALFEVLPRETQDWKLVSALLSERETLFKEGRQTGRRGEQQSLFGERGE
jgi:adenine-specific DNA methylase